MISIDNRKCCFRAQVESIQVNKLQVKFPIPLLFVATILHTLECIVCVTERGECARFTFIFRGIFLKLLEEAQKTSRSDALQENTHFCNHDYVILFKGVALS